MTLGGLGDPAWPQRRLSCDTLAAWLGELEPGLLAMVILLETGQDYRERDLLDKVTQLIEIFGLEGTGPDRRVPLTRPFLVRHKILGKGGVGINSDAEFGRISL